MSNKMEKVVFCFSSGTFYSKIKISDEERKKDDKDTFYKLNNLIEEVL